MLFCCVPGTVAASLVDNPILWLDGSGEKRFWRLEMFFGPPLPAMPVACPFLSVYLYLSLFIFFSVLQHKLRGLREQAVEEAIRLGGYQTIPLGRDRHGRFYYRFPRDSKRVFVSQPVWEGEGDGAAGSGRGKGEDGDIGGAPAPSPSLGVAAATSTGEGGGPLLEAAGLQQSSVPVPRNPAPIEQDLMVYDNDGDVEALLAWLNESGQREGPLRAALLRAFPPSAGQRSKEADDSGEEKLKAAAAAPTAMEVGGEAEDTTAGGGGDCSGASSSTGGGASGTGTGAGEAGGEESAAGQDEDNAVVAGAGAGGGSGGGGAGGGRGGRRGGRRGSDANDRGVLARHSRNQDLPRMLAEGGVELRIAVNPPGANNNVLVPDTKAVVEFDNDAVVAEVCLGRGRGRERGRG